MTSNRLIVRSTSTQRVLSTHTPSQRGLKAALRQRVICHQPVTIEHGGRALDADTLTAMVDFAACGWEPGEFPGLYRAWSAEAEVAAEQAAREAEDNRSRAYDQYLETHAAGLAMAERGRAVGVYHPSEY